MIDLLAVVNYQFEKWSWLWYQNNLIVLDYPTIETWIIAVITIITIIVAIATTILITITIVIITTIINNLSIQMITKE